jgi:hypothetical protein
MGIASAFLVIPRIPADPEAERRLGALRAALENGGRSGLAGPQGDIAAHLTQAAEKLERAETISSTSELLTLAQFGAGSIGAAVADVAEIEDAGDLQALFIAKFLTDVAMMSDRYGFLLPQDLVRRAGLDRANLRWPATAPLFADILSRADDMIERARIDPKTVKSSGVQTLLMTEHQTVRKRIKRLRNTDPVGRRIELNRLERLLIRLRFRLH